jgi:hypothetical protein
VIARHPRSYEREDFVFEPQHYLALIEQKINALDSPALTIVLRLTRARAALRIRRRRLSRPLDPARR